MTSKALTVIAVALGLSGPVAGAALAQQSDPSESVVLVANIISSTHARLTTGVVLASNEPSQKALVVVGASFVSRGDEILVLDGGTDLRTDGRSTRTVARSAQAGIAVLEVDQLTRPGVMLAEWTAGQASQAGTQRFEYLAWPAAQELSSSASIIRQRVEIDVSKAGDVLGRLENLRSNAGVLMNRCGQLAGLVAQESEESESLIASARAIAGVLESAGLSFVTGDCTNVDNKDGEILPEEEGSPPDETSSQSGEEAKVSDSPTLHAVESRPEESGSPSIFSVAYRVFGFAIFALILIAFIADRRRPAAGLNLEPQGERNEKIQVRYRTTSATLQHPGTTVSLEREGESVVVSRRDHEGEAPQVTLSGTAFLEGEELLAGDGDTITLCGASFRIKLT